MSKTLSMPISALRFKWRIPSDVLKKGHLTDSTVENTEETGDINAQSFYTLMKKEGD